MVGVRLPPRCIGATGKGHHLGGVRGAFYALAGANFVFTALLFILVEFGKQGGWGLAQHPAGMANRAGTFVAPQIFSALAIQGLGVLAVQRSVRWRGAGVADTSQQPKVATFATLYLILLPAHFFVCVLHVPYFLYVLRYLVDLIQWLLAQRHFAQTKYCWFTAAL